MLMPDVNVLVYAHRADVAQHDEAYEWLEAVANGQAPFALSALVATAFVRVVTGKAPFGVRATPVSAALDFVDELMSSDACRWVGPGPDYWRLFSGLCASTRSTGKHAADARHAAVAIEHGCTLVSADADFRRFAAHGLRWKHLSW